MSDKQLVLAFFDTEGQADSAVSELKQWDDYMDFLRTMTGTDTSPRSIQAFHAPYLEQRLAQSLPEAEPTAGRSRRPRV